MTKPIVTFSSISFYYHLIHQVQDSIPVVTTEGDPPRIDGTLYWQDSMQSDFEIELTSDERGALQAVLDSVRERVLSRY